MDCFASEIDRRIHICDTPISNNFHFLCCMCARHLCLVYDSGLFKFHKQFMHSSHTFVTHTYNNLASFHKNADRQALASYSKTIVTFTSLYYSLVSAMIQFDVFVSRNGHSNLYLLHSIQMFGITLSI